MDYEGRTKIKDLEVGNSVCIFGTIKKGRLPHNFKKLAVLKLTIGDGSGNINIVMFYGVRNRRMLGTL